jgi:Ni,Fe-hydrogenase maturation factor
MKPTRKSTRKTATKKTIFCFGNPLVKEDSLPLQLIDELQSAFPDITFRPAYTVEDVEDHINCKNIDNGDDDGDEDKEINKELIIIDVVKGIQKISILTDEDIQSCRTQCSLHDFDIGASIQLMKKLGMIKKATIFGIPFGCSKKKVLNALKKLIEMHQMHRPAGFR